VPAFATPDPLIRTLPVRCFLISGGLLLAVWIAQQVLVLSDGLLLVRKIVAIGLILSTAWVIALLVTRNRGKLLWRVRRKLLLSYLFLSVVPIVLVIAFALAGGVVLYDNLAAYLFRQGLNDVIEEVHTISETCAAEIGRNPAVAAAVANSKYSNWASHYPNLSFAIVPTSRNASVERTLTSGPWRHATAPAEVPGWVITAHGFSGALAGDVNGSGGDPRLVIRSAVLTSDGRLAVIVDLPVDAGVASRIAERTGTRIEGITGSLVKPAPASGAPFQRTVAFMEVTAWKTGLPEPDAIHLEAPVGELTQRIAAVQSAQLGSDVNRGLLLFLVVLAALFAIIQGAALVMGGALARSITYAVHELFIGTERVRGGDFTHRIRVESQDQLGDLADSFNRMSGSIEQLLHVQREKQRLDDELRIAREIQKSLLPVRPPQMAGLGIADLCEPAREVGGDYYDFFELGPRQLGVLIADVSGKGTSAALYMAELKGLMLALSHTERSPRQLLMTVNHLLAEHLDNRSFITATYVVIDLDLMTLTYARAGHTPLIVVSGGKSETIVPDGMVLGLRLPGASHRFETLLEEQTRPLHPGDLIVLYTDGITEAMNVDGDLFGDAALGRILGSGSRHDAAAVRERVVREVNTFVGGAEPHDDMTMVVIKIHDV
jgi:sigma-B regulation protein RsbU (phosphoserine phosphatase)